MISGDELAAREEIRALAVDYARALEHRDVDAMVELFTADARFGRYGNGPSALRALTSDALRDSVFTVTLVSNHHIEIDLAARAAHGRVWAHCFAQVDAEGFVEQLVRYDDRYRCDDGRWLFVHRKHRLAFGTAREPSPLMQAPADWPARQTGVGDLPLSDPHFRAWQERRA
ncbi:nuclear transport factor 2 family protein [Mycolicibacterium sp. 018/SC-01/001]|uniref:nuclear transport factor 2 family protein n=1 Tax=Mycolicibacterium sp. 018/SC-01/001 TaxID=2592069 RepID=UPI00117E87FD|nr:nuclear transport factor 2 family protein [Mycolicibacterium sp. 018/SC-01/001]TRW79697.1 nuclear transport factor 2 family protein [Mycolicibacterium sp. 018/SC-01/001]